MKAWMGSIATIIALVPLAAVHAQRAVEPPLKPRPPNVFSAILEGEEKFLKALDGDQYFVSHTKRSVGMKPTVALRIEWHTNRGTTETPMRSGAVVFDFDCGERLYSQRWSMTAAESDLQKPYPPIQPANPPWTPIEEEELSGEVYPFACGSMASVPLQKGSEP